MIKINKSILKNIYKKRAAEAKKYDFGLLTVIGGGEFYSGAPALSAMAAFRSGVDMVRVIAPKRAADIIASFSPILAAYPLVGKLLTEEHLPTLLSMTQSAKSVSCGNTAVVIGGGIGRSEETQQTILRYIAKINVPIVIDADAIYAVGKDVGVAHGKNILFTPHKHEFFVLTGKNINGKTLEEKIKIVKKEAARLNTVILLKGKTDIISDGTKIALNKSGCPFMTVGGTGDTLAGIAGALMARGINCFDAACAAAYINVRAGIEAAKTKKEGLLATDLVDAIYKVIV